MEEKEGTVTLKKSTLWKVGTFVFAGLFIISLFTGGFGIGGDDSGTGNVVAPVQGNNPTAQPTANIKVSVDPDDPVLGDKDAPITLVEFSDFQCPFCARVFDDAIAQLKQNEIKNGEIKLAYKDFPLRSIHPFAQKAAEGAQCAHNQGKFWEYHDALFANQNALSVDDLKKYASDLGLNTGDFNDCLDSGKAKSEVDSDYNQATAAGGRGTPYFIFISPDGEMLPLSGAQPYEAFQSAIASFS